ncbi:hypothetical protein NE237_002628 [Protea cynaroides]|uniref:Senescence regulator n=1 Tax=Protea cynaroides TaxID=273540 RepID=A0A9Q0KVL8_9MAGN|nr:hypothetical protein NE237_002628 [Protea cynaroides]
MAKGRKVGLNTRQERLLGSFGHGGGGGGQSELLEEDVWSMVEDMDNMDLSDHHRDDDSWTANGYWSSHGRRNRRRNGDVGGLSMAFVDDSAGTGKSQGSRIVHQFRGGGQDSVATSAPVKVPDWPKILRVDSVESLHDSDDESAEWVPPHEYLAREYARTRKMTATSVLEGVGRTLKGRDLSRVRNAVWSQTGFDG